MKILKKSTIIVACISAVYLIGALILPYTALSYRSWVNVTGRFLSAVVLPLLLIWLAGKWFCRVVKGKSGIKVLLGIAAFGLYAYWTFWALLLILFTMQEERRLTERLLVTNEATFLSESDYHYYRSVAFFFKIPAELTEEAQTEYLEEKYDRDFVALDEHRFYDIERPTVEVVVENDGMELTDNYVEMLWLYYLEEGCEALDISRDYYVYENNMGICGWTCMELKGEKDIESFARDASVLVQYVMDKTDFFEDYRVLFYFYHGEGEDRITGYLPLWKLNEWDDVQKDYYLQTEGIEARVCEEYQKRSDYLNKKKEEAYQKELEQQLKEQNTPEPIKVEKSLEAMARQTFDEMLSEQGYLYQVKYNAKGNLYIDLGSRPAGENGDKSSEGYYRFTLVYDRTSKNEACELFVLYKEHYTKEDVNDGTAILDMYAVEIATGKVIVADRQAWSDVGTKEYQEATGE